MTNGAESNCLMLNEPPLPDSIGWWATVPHCLPSGIVVSPDGATKLYGALAYTLHMLGGSTARSPAEMLREGARSNGVSASVS